MVSLNSAVIVQRHINSLVLTHFLATQIATDGQDALKLTCGWFFTGIDGRVPVERFIAWCQAFDGHDELLVNGLRQLVRNSLFEGLDSTRLVRKTGDSMEAVVEVWSPEWEALNRQEEGAKGTGESNPAYKAAQYQKERMAGEYLLRELATQGFLPAYGFPTHIAAFDNLTASQFKRAKREREEKKGEDNRYRRRELASRDSVAALREYAPGAEVVMDGLVYRSAGITLNWKAPASEQEARETQAIKYAWRCDRCNHSGSSRLFDETSHCSECNAEIKQENRRTFLEPAGFSVDFYDEPDNDVTTQDFIPVEAPWVSANGDWSLLPNPDFGRFRVTTRGHLFHQSNGLHDEGYAICLACGRAEPMNGESVSKKLLPHKKLRGGKDTTKGREDCPGSHESWAIKPRVTLGHEGYTDVLEIQIKNESGIWQNDKVTALTLAVALRDALAELLGVQVNELGCDEKEARPESGSRCRSILIYDRFAAGYASNAGQFMDRIFRVARDRLNCPANCDSACPHCVLDFDQRFAAESLDRKAALVLLTDSWLQSLRLPDELAYFGPSSRVEHGNIIEAVLRATRKTGAGEVRLFVGGSPDEWDIGPSPLRALAYQLAAAQRKVEIVIEKRCFDALDDVDCQLLASLADYPDSLISVRKIAKLDMAGNAQVVAELRDGVKTCRWAIADVSATAFNMAWGNSAASLIVGANLEPLPLSGEIVTSKQLRRDSVVIGDREIEVFHELDGPLQGFGKRFWKLITRSHAETALLFSKSGDDVVRVSYHDRYLFSPLAAALLVDLIAGFRDTVGKDRCGNPVIEITTTNEPSPGKNRNGLLWDNWVDMGTRDGAISHALEYHGLNAVLRSVDKNKSLHGRVLEVEFSSKRILIVRFDQGVSYWRAKSSNRRKFFDFDEPDLIAQGIKVAELSIDVESNSFPTHLFIKTR